MIKITINPNHIYNVFLGMAMMLNYAIEGAIWYAIIKVVWFVSNNPDERLGYLWLLLGGAVLLIIRAGVSMAEASDEDVRIRHYNWHYLQLYRTIVTIKAYSDTKIIIEIKEPPKALEDKSEELYDDRGDPW